MVRLSDHGVRFEEKIRRHGGKHVPHSCPEEYATGKPVVFGSF